LFFLSKQKKIIREKRKSEYRFSVNKLYYFKYFKKLLQSKAVKRRKKKKNKKHVFQFRYIYNKSKYRQIYKRILLLKKVFVHYYIKITEKRFKQLNYFYCLKTVLTKFEKFLYFFESQVSSVLLRIKLAKTQYHAVRYVTYGGVFLNGFQITYIIFLTKNTDLLELAYRFYRYGYSKRYLKYRKYVRLIRRRALLLNYYYNLGKYLYFRRKQIFKLHYANRFFEKNRRVVAVILVRQSYRNRYRKFFKQMTFRSLMLISGLYFHRN
jgi:hypothetical protein